MELVVLPWQQVFFAVLLVGVSIGQVLPHVQQLLSAHRAASTLEAIVTRVSGLVGADRGGCTLAIVTESNVHPRNPLNLLSRHIVVVYC